MRKQIVALGTIVGILLSAIPVVPTLAASGDLDPDFGTGGSVTTDFGPGNSTFATAVAIQANGMIVTGGVGGNSQFALARYDADGNLDDGFAGDGTLLGETGAVTAIAIQADGKILAAGSMSPIGFVLARYTTDGVPDSTFDGDGFTTISTFGGVRALVIQGDGKIVAAGRGATGFALARFNTNGSPDLGFDADGKAETNFGGVDDSANGVVVQADGKIVAAGRGGPGVDFILARFTTAGVLDATFGTGGTVTTDFGGFEGANALAIQADGKLVAAGDGIQHFSVARYNANGSLDAGFDGDGKIVTQFFPGSSEMAYAVAIQSNGKIVVGGRVLHDFDSSFAIARYDTDGWLDGRTTADFGDPADVGVLCNPGRADCSEDVVNGVAIQADGKIVAAGGSGPCGGPCEWTVARFGSIAPIRELSIAPATVDFGTVTAGGTPGAATVTVTNTGSVASTISLVELVGGQPAAFAVTDQGCGLTPIAPKASCEIDLQFAPSTGGAAGTDLRIHSDTTAGLLTVPLAGTGQLPPSGITWGTIRRAGPAYTFNSGGGLARTVKSGAQKLHVAYATIRIGSSWAKNSGPRMGVYYVRSSSGATWTTPKRLNPSTQHAARVGIAAAGSRVYVSWVSQTRVTSVKPTAARVLYVRVNTNHGASTSWRSTVRLTSTTGRVDFPTIAASGTDAYIAFTDSVTGSIRLARSTNRGVTWTKQTLGSTTASSAEGRIGFPSVAVSGSNVVVAWNADANGTVAVRRSTDRGATWSSTQVLTADAAASVSTAALGSRLAVTWTTGTEIHVRVFSAGSWGPDRLVGVIGPDAQLAYSPAVALQGTSRLAVSWSERIMDDHARLDWSESPNDGALWFATQVTADYTTTTTRRLNDWPSIVWPSESTRYVLWNGSRAGSNDFRLYLRTGSGLPIGPASAVSGGKALTPSAIAPDRGDADSGRP